MRLLIDEDVDVRLIGVLRRWGHEAKRVPVGTKNGAVIALAKAERRVLLTRDSDFTDSVKFPPVQSAGIIHVEIHPPRLAAMVSSLKTLLAEIPASAFGGRLFVLDETGYSEFS